MVIHKDGDKSKAICENCGRIVATTFRYADFVVNGSKVPDVLQGFCDVCGESVSLPHQSTFRIKEYRENNYSHSLEFRIPSHFTDILLAIGGVHKISRKPNLLCRLLSELYLGKLHHPGGQKLRKKIIEALNDDLAQGKSKDRLSCVFPDITYSALKTIAGEEHKTNAEIVKGVIMVAKRDLLDKKNTVFGREFEELAAARL
jgi:hypothetical protein